MEIRDIDGLLTALKQLEDTLVEANALFRAGDDAGRAGALMAVNATIQFISSNEEWRPVGLAIPLGELAGALLDLSYGARHPMLQPDRVRGRPPETRARQVVKAYAAATMQLLHALGGYPLHEAGRDVAACLHKHGHDTAGPHKSLTGETIAQWRRDLETAKPDRLAAQIYRDLVMQNLVVMTDDRAAIRRDLLARLSRVLEQVKGSSEPT